MKHPLAHLSDSTLTDRLDQLARRDRGTTVELLLHIAEFDRRRLYAPAGFPSMHGYCVGRLRMSDDVAFKRIRVARAALRFPSIQEAIGDGRLNVSGVVLLAPHLKALTRREGEALLAQAENRRKREIEQLLAERFPQPDRPTFVVPVAPALPEFRQLAPGPVDSSAMAIPTAPVAAETHAASVLAPSMAAATPVAAPAVPTHARVAPLAPGRFVFQMTIGQGAHDKLVRLQALLSHEIPPGDLERIIERAFDLALAQLEKRKYAPLTSPARASPVRPTAGTFRPRCGARCMRAIRGDARS